MKWIKVLVSDSAVTVAQKIDEGAATEFYFVAETDDSPRVLKYPIYEIDASEPVEGRPK